MVFVLFLLITTLAAAVSALIPIFPGDKLHGITNDSLSDIDPHKNSYGPWSACTATCAPAWRVRKKVTCNSAIDAACSEIKPCDRKLPECGSDSFAVDIHLLTGESENFTCPLHTHEPALRLAWYRWLNGTWQPYLPYENSRVIFHPHTLHMVLRLAAESDTGSYKCVLLYPDGRVMTAKYYHLKVTRNFTILKEALAALSMLVTLILLGLCVRGFCLPGSKTMLPCFKVDPTKKMSELYYSRLKEEGIIK